MNLISIWAWTSLRAVWGQKQSASCGKYPQKAQQLGWCRVYVQVYASKAFSSKCTCQFGVCFFERPSGPKWLEKWNPIGWKQRLTHRQGPFLANGGMMSRCVPGELGGIWPTSEKNHLSTVEKLPITHQFWHQSFAIWVSCLILFKCHCKNR